MVAINQMLLLLGTSRSNIMTVSILMSPFELTINTSHANYGSQFKTVWRKLTANENALNHIPLRRVPMQLDSDISIEIVNIYLCIRQTLSWPTARSSHPSIYKLDDRAFNSRKYNLWSQFQCLIYWWGIWYVSSTRNLTTNCHILSPLQMKSFTDKFPIERLVLWGFLAICSWRWFQFYTYDRRRWYV